MRAQLPFTQLTNLARMALKLLSYYPGEIPKALNAERRTQTWQHKQMKPARWQIVKGPLEKQKATENVRRTFGSSKKKKKRRKGKQTASTAGKAHYVPPAHLIYPLSLVISLLWPLCYFDFIL